MSRAALVTLAACLGLGTALGLPATAAPPATREAIEISVLTYNIHGLPSWIARDDPSARIPVLLDRAGAYDLVLLQEDFAHQERVDEHARQPFRWRGIGPWLPFFGQGAGLTILSRWPRAEPLVPSAYGVCSGWILLSSGNDCFGNKGFLFARLALENGAEIDVWNTHLDAGDHADDQRARARQLALLGDAVEAQSAGRAVLLGGDLNLEWSEPGDRLLLDRFRDRLGLEVAAHTPAAGWVSHLDYLLIRSGDAVQIRPLASGKDESFLGDGHKPLSDHPAVFARLRVH